MLNWIEHDFYNQPRGLVVQSIISLTKSFVKDLLCLLHVVCKKSSYFVLKIMSGTVAVLHIDLAEKLRFAYNAFENITFR